MLPPLLRLLERPSSVFLREIIAVFINILFVFLTTFNHSQRNNLLFFIKETEAFFDIASDKPYFSEKFSVKQEIIPIRLDIFGIFLNGRRIEK